VATAVQLKKETIRKSVTARSTSRVLVGHDSVNRALLLELIELPLSAYWRLAQEPCCINEIDVNEAAVRVRSINETQHLEAIAAEHDAQ
jgi:probable phosphoglycerate mutase